MTKRALEIMILLLFALYLLMDSFVARLPGSLLWAIISFLPAAIFSFALRIGGTFVTVKAAVQKIE